MELTATECDEDWLAIAPACYVWKKYKCSMTDQTSE